MTRLIGLLVFTLLVGAAPASAASWTTCYDRNYEDLKAKRIRCDTAARVYRASNRAAADGRRSFKLVGLRWTCGASNPPAVEFYTWRCTASGGRAMQYRWKSGD
jgi:hypothetical protein